MGRLRFDTRSLSKLAIFLAFLIFVPSWAMASDPPVNAISYRKARSIALHARHGKLTKNFEQKQWRGIWVYDFNILGDDQILHEVVVDMATGKILMGAAKRNPKKTKKIIPVPATASPTPLVSPK